MVVYTPQTNLAEHLSFRLGHNRRVERGIPEGLEEERGDDDCHGKWVS